MSTPADQNDGVSKKLEDKAHYQSMVGSLLCPPDIAQAVGAVSKFCALPTEAHLTAVKRVLRYLSGTRDLALKYQKSKE